ncbi:MAG: hypothetical protein ACI9HU_001916, partial [Colwellia sp.]
RKRARYYGISPLYSDYSVFAQSLLSCPKLGAINIEIA